MRGGAVIGLLALVVGLLGAAAAGAQYEPGSPEPPSADPGLRASQAVEIRDFRFAPRMKTVRQGAAVTWVWRGETAHNVAFRMLRKRSRTQVRGKPYRLRFSRRGTYRYLCTVHGFTGSLVVK